MQVLLPSGYYFRGRTFLGTDVSAKQSLFLIVQHNQFHDIYTSIDFLLASIHSFKYTMVWFGFEILQVANTVLIPNQDVFQMWLFSKLVVIVVSSSKLENSPNEFRNTCGSKDVAMTI